MTAGYSHLSGVEDGKRPIPEWIGSIRGGRVMAIESPAGEHYVRPNPRGDHGGQREFAVIGYGPGGGYVGEWCASAEIVKRYFARADGTITVDDWSLWPDGHDASPEVTA